MYETRLFGDGKTFLEWAQKNVHKSTRANDMVGWNGAINYIPLDRDLVLLYQLEKTGQSWNVCGLHMLLWGVQETLRKDVCKISEFYRPEGSVFWHASVVYGGRSPLDFCVTNAFQAAEYEKYSKGGNFTMTWLRQTASTTNTFRESATAYMDRRTCSGRFTESRRRSRRSI